MATNSAWIGWSSGAILVATILVQIVRQWKTRSSEDVSPLLFVGQLIASIGLIIYSVMTRQTTFVVINSAMALAAAVGGVVWWLNRNRGQDKH